MSRTSSFFFSSLTFTALTAAAAEPLWRDVTVSNQALRAADARKAPFLLTGFPFRTSDDAPFRRLPEDFTEKQVNSDALGLSAHTSGGAVLFRTDSPVVAILSDPCTGTAMQHMPATGVSGFDLYERIPDAAAPRERFVANIKTVAGGTLAQTGAQPGKLRDFILYLPLYAPVKTLEIALAPDARIEPPTPQRFKRPFVFYGSSITQGGCCSRPANNYTTMLCRTLDAPQVNLGFSGSAKGEPAVARAIASLDAELFVYDYDHNAPNEAHLEATHEAFFRIIREARPTLPVIILTRPNAANGGARRDIIRRTYEHALQAGDKHVYFLAGDSIFGYENALNFGTVDGCHPNDIGFYWMYSAVLPVVRKALGLDGR